LLDVPVEDADWERLDPPKRRQRLLEGLRRLTLRESQVQPLVLVFEDLHWIDGETQVFLDHLIESLPTARLLMLVNYRPEYSHGWGSKSYYRQLRIDPLSTASVEQLLETLLGVHPSMVELRPMLTARTEGNPFFLEETVQSLIETGALVGERSAYRLIKPLQALNIPATAQTVLAARIDRLAPDDKRLLQTASVIGKDVPYPLLRSIAEMDETALHAGLARLRASEFLYETRLFPELEYTFKHALTQQVAYQSILQERRRALHARLVESIEALDAGRMEDHIERLAEHAQRGEVWEKAVVYVPQAGVKASGRGASKEAAISFEQALAALAQLPESPAGAAREIDLRIELRNNLLVHGQVGPALECISLAESTARLLADRHRLARVLAHKTHSLWLMGRDRQAIEVGREALSLAKTMGDFSLIVAATQYLGQVHRTTGEYSLAIPLLRENVAALRGAPAEDRLGMHALPAVLARGFLADCLSLMGEFSEAIAVGREAVEIAKTVGHTFSMVVSLAQFGRVYVRKGDTDEGIPILEQGLELCQAYGMRQWLMGIAANLSLAYSLTGQSTAASITLDRVSEVIATAAIVTAGPDSWGADLSQALLLANRVDDAKELLDRFEDQARAEEQPVIKTWIPRIRAEIALRRNATDPGEAMAYYHSALEQGRLFGLRPHIAHCHLALSRLYRRTGKPEEVQEHLTSATTMYGEMDMQLWLEQAAAEAAGRA
jgi:tetratricopeptide (TPR) repeat protein